MEVRVGSKVRVGAVLVLVLALGAGASALAAVGGDATIKVKTLENGKSRYFGKVRSDDPRCEPHRKVKVTAGDSILVRTRTDDHGKFDAVGKSATPDRKLHVKVAPKGELCLKLLGTGRAP
jgi:hypothetical protein